MSFSLTGSILGKLLLKLEEIQQDRQLQASEKDLPAPLSEQEHEAALNFLKNKNLIELIRQDFKKIGIVGEENNTLVGYLGCVSRKLDRPLAIIIQSSSAAGDRRGQSKLILHSSDSL